MAYLNFNKIVPPAPNEPFVNEVTQLNDNWDHLDLKLQPYVKGGTISNIELGQEYFDTNFSYSVWDGAAGVTPDDIPQNWTAWTVMPMVTGRVQRSGFNMKWRNNPTYRMVELTGGVIFNATADPWPLGTAHVINDDVAGAIPATMQPIGGLHVSQAAAALTAGTSVVAAAHVMVDKPVGNTFVRIRAQYLGGPGGGNFVMFDQVWWWY